jgi:hypothetical protein
MSAPMGSAKRWQCAVEMVEDCALVGWDEPMPLVANNRRSHASTVHEAWEKRRAKER